MKGGMAMISKRIWSVAWIGMIFWSLAGAGWATPQLGVSGRLLDAKGEPIRYYEGSGMSRHEVEVQLAAELKFYDSETTTTVLHTIATTAKAFGGYFSIYFTLPGSVLLKDHIYYALAIDTDRNGLSGADLFAGRFQFGAVPFALSAQPAHAFTTHGGKVNSGSGFAFPDKLKVMRVAPFEAPSGGVEFNKMNILVSGVPAGCTFTFGIYDEQGKIVVSSGPISVKDVSITNAYLDVKLPQTVKLEPAKIYYTGYASNNGNLCLPGGYEPVNPVLGEVSIPTNDGLIPNSFDPSKIVLSDNGRIPLPITLTLVATPPAPARQGVDPSKTQVRWIYTKNSKVVNAKSESDGE